MSNNQIIIKATVVVFAISSFFSACKKYETQFDGPYNDEVGVVAQPVDYEIAAVINGQIFMVDDRFRNSKTLPNISNASLVSINNAHTKIAYKATGGNIIIVDTAGVKIADVPNSAGVTQFDFHTNNETLVMLQDFNLTFFGPSVGAAVTDLKSATGIFGSEWEINAAYVDVDGNVIWIYRVYTGLNYQHGVRVRYKSGSSRNFDLGFSRPVRLKISETSAGKRFIVTEEYTFDTFISLEGFFDAGSSDFLSDFASNDPDGFWTLSPKDGVEMCYWTSFFGTGGAFVFRSTGQQFQVANGTLTDLDW